MESNNMDTIKPNPEDKMPKRVAAFELYKVHKKSYLTAVMGIVGLFITVIVSVFSAVGGSITIGIISFGLAWIAFTDKNKMAYLNKNYALGIKEQIWQKKAE